MTKIIFNDLLKNFTIKYANQPRKKGKSEREEKTKGEELFRFLGSC